MKHVALPLIVALLLTGSAVASTSLLPVSEAQPTTLLSVDFTGSTLPAGWLLQGSAKFIGGLNSSSGFGGIQLVNSDSEEGAAIYGTPFTTQNIIIELSGMYTPGCTFEFYCDHQESDDLGVGFYSDGPLASVGSHNPASSNGYYASYEFLGGGSNIPSLIHDGHSVSLGGNLPPWGTNYLFTDTMVTPTSVSMNTLTSTNGPFTQAPSISLTNMLTYNNATGLDNSHSTLYIGGATVTGFVHNPWAFIYVYWLRILSYSTSISSEMSTLISGTSQTQTVVAPITQFVTQTVTSTQPPLTQTQSVTQSITQTVTQGQTTPTPVLSTAGANSVLLYAVIGAVVVVAVVLVGVFLALRSRGDRGTARPTYGAVKVCQVCGSPLSGLERFCDRCGAPQG
jgi:hypothetical protein